MGDFNTLPHGSRLLLQQFGCDSQNTDSSVERRIVMLEYLLEQEYTIDEYELDSTEVSSNEPMADLIEMLDEHYGEWLYRIIDQYPTQTLWSYVDEHGAVGAFELILGQQDPTNLL